MSCSCPPRAFATLTDLSAAGPLFPDGALVTTGAPRAARWTMAKGSSLTADGRKYIAAAGGGVWVRDLATGAPGASTVAAWFVATNGNDNLDGLTPSTALASLDEVLCRIGGQTIDGAVTPVVAITLDHTYIDASDRLVALRLANLATIVIAGERVMAITATCTAVNAWDDSVETIGSYAFAPSLAAYVGRFARVVSGPNAALRTPIAKALGSGVLRGVWMDPNTYLTGEPAVGDIVEVLSLPALAGNLKIQALGDGTIGFQDIELGVPGADHSVEAIEGGITFLSCIVHGLDVYETVTLATIAGSYTLDCRVYGQAQTFGSVHASAGGAYLAARGNGVVQVIDRTLVQGGAVQVGHAQEGPGHLMTLPYSAVSGQGPGTLAIADYAGDAMVVTPGSTVQAGALVYARDTAVPGLGNGFHVVSGGAIYYDPASPPALVGSLPASAYLIGGNVLSSLPGAGYSASNGARMVPAA